MGGKKKKNKNAGGDAGASVSAAETQAPPGEAAMAAEAVVPAYTLTRLGSGESANGKDTLQLTVSLPGVAGAQRFLLLPEPDLLAPGSS